MSAAPGQPGEHGMLPFDRGKSFRQALIVAVVFTAFISVLVLGLVGANVVLLGGSAETPRTVTVLSVAAAAVILAAMVVMMAMVLRARSAIVGDHVRIRVVTDARRTVTWCGLATIGVGVGVLIVGFALSVEGSCIIPACALFVAAVFSFYGRAVIGSVTKALS